MKVGKEARDTNPMEPLYCLPSFVEPWIPLPKFVRDRCVAYMLFQSKACNYCQPSFTSRMDVVYLSTSNGSHKKLRIESEQNWYYEFNVSQPGKYLHELMGDVVVIGAV